MSWTALDTVTIPCPVCGVCEVTVEVRDDGAEWETECSCGVNHLVNEEAYRAAIESAAAQAI